ncbi:MAG: hypothetical protein QOJ27_2436 [Sphingomonadales bacterium]|nr:hypothetical protein [Sphingomonadales bacterium]
MSELATDILPDPAPNDHGGERLTEAGRRRLHPDDELVFPLSKGAFAQYWEETGAPRALRLFYRDKEIRFDDPAFFAFGETLASQSRFRAGDAVSWGAVAWTKVREMLEQLVEAGVLHRADEADDLPGPLRHEDRESPLEPTGCTRPHTWDERDGVVRTISGKTLETGYLELVVPVFRVAHMYLDADDRQVGEANVFPPLMRLERPTLWRTCPYSGSRYQPDLPMNVTALRIMRTYWRQMMVVVRRVSDAYRARYPAVGERGWTVGDIERMTICVMALPSYLLMRREGRVENGRLHPALSSAFRLTDGPRTLMHDMVFAPAGEPARSRDTPMTGAELHAYAERTNGFRTERGVCSGPPAMIDDFLAVILDGEDPKGGWPDSLDPEVADALHSIEPAIDYALTGMQAFASVFSLFSASRAAHAALRQMLPEPEEGDSPGLAALRAGLDSVRESRPAEGWEAEDALSRSRLAAYDDLYRQCGFGLTGREPDRSLLSLYEKPPPLPAETLAALASAFAHRLDGLPDGEALAAGLAARLGRFAGFVQAMLDAALEAQGRINALLGRPAPAQPFMGRDLARYMAMRRGPGQDVKAPPFLIDEVARHLGVTIEIGRDGVTIAAGAGAD